MLMAERCCSKQELLVSFVFVAGFGSFFRHYWSFEPTEGSDKAKYKDQSTFFL